MEFSGKSRQRVVIAAPSFSWQRYLEHTVVPMELPSDNKHLSVHGFHKLMDVAQGQVFKSMQGNRGL